MQLILEPSLEVNFIIPLPRTRGREGAGELFFVFQKRIRLRFDAGIFEFHPSPDGFEISGVTQNTKNNYAVQKPARRLADVKDIPERDGGNDPKER